MKVNEIFLSIQGEGKQIGRPQVFIRLSGCNMRCNWCIGVRPGRRIPRIITSNCANKKIMDVVMGDKVLALDDNGVLAETVVQKIFKRKVDAYYEIKVEGKPLLHFTPEHEFKTNNGWIKVKDLRVGDEIYHIQSIEKNRFFARHYNCMFNKTISEKSRRNIDYTLIGRKISKTRKRLYRTGLLKPMMTILQERDPERYKQMCESSSKRMRAFNPMKKPDVASRMVKTSRSRGFYEKVSKRMKKNNPTKSPRFREYITKNNPMKNPEIAKKSWMSHQRRPSSIEKRVMCLVEDNNIPLDYVGNGKLWVGSKKDKLFNPDFVIKRQSKVVEVYDPTYLKRGERWSRQRKNHFKKYGYKCLVLPVSRKTTDGVILKKLRKFISNGLKVLSIRSFTPNKKYPYQNPKPLTVYNLKCKPYNNFFVDYLLVHNCDTKYTWERGEEKSVDEILERIGSYGVKSVCITGGEPMLQLEELRVLIKKLKERNYEILLETNGTVYDKELFGLVDCVSMDIKPPSSGEKSDERLIEKLQEKDQIKIVVAGDEDYEFARRIVPKSGVEVILQPEGGKGLESLAERVIKDRLNVRVLPQLHKLLGIK